MPEPSPRAAFLAAADQLETWATTVPRWDPHGTEPWYVCAERRFDAENAILARLRREPSCEVDLCPLRIRVRLVVAGLAAVSAGGLEGALRAWAARARTRWSEAHLVEDGRGAGLRPRPAQPSCSLATSPAARPARSVALAAHPFHARVSRPPA